jgi:galactofuranosylgalactofuranosylrhamnosyl-N-acetylglucosaminyl-diphospho-decaprenol beta-1,5/1,6-galactofuranosyltransferase
MLITAALHFPRSGRGLAVLVLKRLLGQLLTYRYYSAALILRAVADYLRGPAVLEEPPWALHAALDAEKARFPPVTAEAERVAPPAGLAPDPRSRAQFLAKLVRATVRNLLSRTPTAPPTVRVSIKDLLWFRVLHHDRIVAETGWEANPPVFQRDPVAFRQLLVEGLCLVVRVARHAALVQTAWRDAQLHFGSREFWRDYFSLAPTAAQDTEATHPLSPRGQDSGRARRRA